MTDADLQRWLSENIDSQGRIPGAICLADDSGPVGAETEPDEWLITDATAVMAFIERWRKT